MSFSGKLEPFRKKSPKRTKKNPAGSHEPEYGPGYSEGRRLLNDNDRMKSARLPVKSEPDPVQCSHD
jgi:hypothetical protein